MNKIIGRSNEIKTLSEMLQSNRPEFLALYGRRRIGKTFLIRSFFEKKKVIFFDLTGRQGGSLKYHMNHFDEVFKKIFFPDIPFLSSSKNWEEAFDRLTQAIKMAGRSKKIVLFFDEFPWMASKNSKLLQILDHFWNHEWSRMPQVKLIICGSSASWIIKKIINHRGGLHNRMTRNIYLMPFHLGETVEYLKSMSVDLPLDQMVEIYMTMGGVPYYLNQVQSNLSAVQNIGYLAFEKNSFFVNEFKNLFSALLDHPDDCIKLLKYIASKPQGLSQSELLEKMGSNFKGSRGIKLLDSLEDAYFIIKFSHGFQNKRSMYYKLIDPYCLFYFYWIEPVSKNLLRASLGIEYWNTLKKTPAWYAWAGLAFEILCYEHIPLIRHALGLSPLDLPTTWRYRPRGSQDRGAQIDLLFDRQDGFVTLCEIKYTQKPFVLDKAYVQHLEDVTKIFKKVTRTSKKIVWALISAQGVKDNIHSRAYKGCILSLEEILKRV